MKIKRFNESLSEDEIKSLFSYAADLSKNFDFENADFEDEKNYIVWLEHDFYDISSYDSFTKYVELVNEVRDACDKLIKIYNASISFEEQSNSQITIMINYED